jgi:hypothetical protein
MLVGHHAVGFAAKRFVPSVSLGTLQFACVLPDLLTFVLQIFGVEHARITPGVTPFSSLDGYDTALSHSLATTMVWSAVFAAVWLWRRRRSIEAAVLGSVVFSHWILDVVSHRPEIALFPRIHHYVGLGLWNSIAATFIVEGALWLLGILMYLRVTRAISKIGVWGLWSFVSALTLLWISTPFVPQPVGEFSHTELGVTLAAYSALFVLAHWTDRNRTIRQDRLISLIAGLGGKA